MTGHPGIVVNVWGQRFISPFTVYILGTEHRPSGWETGSFACPAILPTLTRVFLGGHGDLRSEMVVKSTGYTQGLLCVCDRACLNERPSLRDPQILLTGNTWDLKTLTWSWEHSL